MADTEQPKTRSEPNLTSNQSSYETTITEASLANEGGHDEGVQRQDTAQIDEADKDLEKDHTKHVHLDLEELDKLEKQKKAKVFADLVLYDERGKPYIDVNRLIYKPRKRYFP